ncbi:MAG: hypothetical protein U9N42_03395 [Campylobacterota bacterium]|nr:hypothetical protein [Campylobacterota bacterium]
MQTVIDYKDEAAVAGIIATIVFVIVFALAEPLIDLYCSVRELVILYITDIRVAVFALSIIGPLLIVFELIMMYKRDKRLAFVAFISMHIIDYFLNENSNKLVLFISALLKNIFNYLFASVS